MKEEENELHTVEEAAKQIGRSVTWVRKTIAEHKLQYFIAAKRQFLNPTVIEKLKKIKEESHKPSLANLRLGREGAPRGSIQNMLNQVLENQQIIIGELSTISVRLSSLPLPSFFIEKRNNNGEMEHIEVSK